MIADPRPCFIPGCDNPPTVRRFGWECCRTHYAQLWVGGWLPRAMMDAYTATCRVDGCDNPSTILDHDNACCRTLRKTMRCGKCNRGFVCQQCNRQIWMVEAQTSKHAERIPPERIDAIRAYLAEFAPVHTVQRIAA